MNKYIKPTKYIENMHEERKKKTMKNQEMHNKIYEEGYKKNHEGRNENLHEKRFEKMNEENKRKIRDFLV